MSTKLYIVVKADTKFWKGKKFSEEHKQNLRKPKIRKNAK